MPDQSSPVVDVAPPATAPSTTPDPASDDLARVGIDVGGTKTHIAVVTVSGDRTDLIVPSAQWRSNSLFSTTENLARLAALAAGTGRISAATVVVAGMHGCDTADQEALASSTLAAALGCTVTVINDAVLLAHAAGATSSLQMIVGTGAVVVGRTAAGAPVSADGYGWLLSDYGSAPGLVRESVREILRRIDLDVLGDDPLLPLLLDSFSVTGPTELALAMTDEAGITAWGDRAPLVFDAAELGSGVALLVIDDAARRLAEGVSALLRRGAVATSVVAAGGVLVNQVRLQEGLRSWLARLAPDLDLLVLLDAPVEGALALAAGSEPAASPAASSAAAAESAR